MFPRWTGCSSAISDLDAGAPHASMRSAAATSDTCTRRMSTILLGVELCRAIEAAFETAIPPPTCRTAFVRSREGVAVVLSAHVAGWRVGKWIRPHQAQGLTVVLQQSGDEVH